MQTFIIAAARDGGVMLTAVDAPDYDTAFKQGLLLAQAHHGLDWVHPDDIEGELDGYTVSSLAGLIES